MNKIESPTFIFHKPYVICILYLDGKKGATYTGIAKCNPRDKWNLRTGIELAYVRAMKDIAEHYEHQVMGISPYEAQGINPVEAHRAISEVVEKYSR